MINGKKVALIFGIGGQDGSYLAEFLLSKGYVVRGVVRRASFPNTKRIDHLDIYDDKYGKTPASPFYLLYGDLADSTSIRNILEEILPDEVYNLGAQSHVGISFQNPESTMNFNALGPLRILEAIKDLKLKCKYYQASSSEMFGISPPPQNEDTTMLPISPYGIAKLAGYHLTRMYRKAYGIFACNGILFNHESPRRGETFVTKKITQAVARIYQGRQKVLKLGNIDAKRDWGHAKDFVYAQWLMLQQDKPQDYVIATGETHTVREFVELAFKEIGVNIVWKGEGINEKGIDEKTENILVEIEKKYFRPAEVELLLGDPSKAEKELNWKRSVSFQELVSGMVKYDLENDSFGGKE